MFISFIINFLFTKALNFVDTFNSVHSENNQILYLFPFDFFPVTIDP